MVGSGRLNPAATAPPATDRAATINDVAKLAGVSRQTVTRAMHDMAGISAATRTRVLDAADALAYRPSRFGRGLVRQRHYTLGLLISDLTNPYYPELASSVVGVAARAGWNVVLADFAHIPDQDAYVIELADQVDAIVGYLPWVDAEIPRRPLDLALRGLPVVEIDARPSAGRSAVVFDLRPAVHDAVDLLVGSGVRVLAVLDLPGGATSSDRARLIAETASARGLRVVRWDASGNSVTAATAATTALLASGRRIDAIMCFNDIVAIGALHACRTAHIAVPDHVKVIGIDGLQIGTELTPSLTTLAVDMSEVARNTVELVVAMHDRRHQPGRRGLRRRVAHRLVVRESAR